MEDWKAAWLAAWIDGEGSVMLNKRTGRATTTGRGVHYRGNVIVVTNTNFAIFDVMRERGVPGQLYEHKVGADRASHNPRKRRQWTLRWNHGQIRELLPIVQPWLVLKAPQAELLLEALAIKAQITPGQPGFLPQNRGRLVERLDSIYASIRELNTRGRE